MEKEIKIFYSWQSDLPKDTNLNGIRQSLRLACNTVENEFDNLKIELDESTRNVSGSPNIPDTIFKKIPLSDIFICDLSTINKTTSGKLRKLQNPNVLIELGYAIAKLGWNRIIILFNGQYGEHSDLPFDIDRHRASKFIIKDKNDKNGKNSLAKLLSLAIKSIIDENPKTPSQLASLTPEERKHNINVNNLEWVLSTIHIPTFDYFLGYIPLKIIGRIFHFWESFRSVMESNQFYLYDKQAEKLLNDLKKYWGFSLAFDHRYNPDGTGENYNYYIPADVFPDKDSENDFKKLTKNKTELDQAFKNLLNFIRTNYIEINLDETSDKAIIEYKKFNEEMIERMK